MSFFNNNSDAAPGTFSGGLNGVNEKVCIQVKKVFDACMKQVTMENVTLRIDKYIPENPDAPITFISARSTSSHGIIKNLLIDRLDDRPHFGRVRCDVEIPVQTVYVDSQGVEGKGCGVLTLHEDVVLYIPEASIMPYSVEAVCSAICPEGTFVAMREDDLLFNVEACMSVILKIVIEAELLIPSYGYASIPPCQDYAQEVCSGFFELPLFPSTRRDRD